jgi:Carboxypeptidase regulatory-like domain
MKAKRSESHARVLLCALVLAMFVIGVSGHAQTTTGSIYGTILDPSNAILPGAVITVTNVATGEVNAATSDSSGNYSFPIVLPGDYTASAQRTGFGTETQVGLRVDSNQNVHVNFTLSIGSTVSSVTVTAATTMVDTSESQLGYTVDQQRITDLPLNGRSAYSLVQITPGVTDYAAGSTLGDVAGTTFSANGMRTTYNTYYLDGSFDETTYREGGNIIPDPDGLQEFRLLTSNFDAEFGHSPGAVVNLITRSGTDQFHGLLFEYLRNNIFNAKSYFDDTVTPLKQNQFGGTFGGPILRKKMFGFFSYEGLRIDTPTVVTASSIITPTAAEAGGNLSALPMSQWPKEANGTYYSCNGVRGVICPDLLDPVAGNLLKTVPLSNPASGHPAQQNQATDSAEDQYLGRVDYHLTKHALEAMYFTSKGTGSSPTAGGNDILAFSGVSDFNRQINGVLSDTWTISPTVINSVRAIYMLNHNILGNIFSGNDLPALGSLAPEGSTFTTQPQVTITGYWDMGSGSSGVDNQTQQALGILDTFYWTHGNHNVKLGGNFLWNKYAETGGYAGSAQIGFTGSTTGSVLGDFLLGFANSWRQNAGVFHRLHAADPGLFVQDNWKISPRLTLNLGVRWEVYAPFVGQNNLGTFKPYVQSKRFPTAPLGLLSAGDPGVPDGIVPTQWHEFSPRVGFAYDVFGKGTTALRGAFGVFDAANMEGFAANLEQQPFLLDLTINKTPNLVCPFGGSVPRCPAGTPVGTDPFPYTVNLQNPTFTSGATSTGMAPNAGSVPYVYEYNLTLQQEWGSHWSTQLAYVGNQARRAYILRDQNSPVYSPGASISTAGLNGRRPYEPEPETFVFGAISELAPSSNSNYNSLQLSLERRLSHGFSLLASYVWSKTLSDVDSDPASASGTSLVNQNNVHYDYGKSVIDKPQSFVASYIWQLPMVARWGFLGREVLSGWQVNGITTLSTGTPFNVVSGTDTNLDGNSGDRPNVVGNPIIPGGQSRQAKIAGYFNTSAFAPVPAGVPYGNAQRDLLIGPGYVDTDFSAFKAFTFPLFDRQNTLQIRGEMFNLFNNVNLSSPTATFTSGNFGKITGTNASRVTQFSLRYSF